MIKYSAAVNASVRGSFPNAVNASMFRSMWLVAEGFHIPFSYGQSDEVQQQPSRRNDWPMNYSLSLRTAT
ncbi:hypothetical protein T07_10143 [Trichinella nelsoni]|uniref:Uncharacterized protein n=1 Tax=Trichinella nelsoni TaxID=6336 RepID=A0A0V0RP88_9BILA|nr:hypothetical protein T07_8133 [Trichinella nelsoni]KRX16286.1 hypothetical protein T07_10143 [Trichinella nelsoni]